MGFAPYAGDGVHVRWKRLGVREASALQQGSVTALRKPTPWRQPLHAGRRAIARVKNEQQRADLLAAAIGENLSLIQIKELIQELQAENKENIPLEKVVSQRVANISKQIKSAKICDDAKKFKKLEKLLGDIENLFAET